MKKSIFSLFLVALAACAMAQTTVPNGGFENWTNGRPDNWTTSISGNVIATLPYIGEFPYPVSANFGSQTSDAHSGNYALKLMASTIGVPSTSYSLKIPGIAQLGSAGEFNIPMSVITDLISGGLDSLNMDNIESLATFLNSLASGMPCESTPENLKLWVKYLPQNMDTMRVIAYTKQNGTPVSYAQIEVSETLSEYTQLVCSFDSPFAPCDSICIIIASGGFTTSDSTELYVDDVELNYYVGVAEHETVKVNIYPNPATDRFCIAPASGERYQYKLSDLTGRTIAFRKNVTGVEEVNVHSLVPGVYMLFIEQGNQTLTKKVVVQ